MGNLFDMGLLLLLIAIIGVWLKLSRAREQAVREARRQCERHGLQLLDETVGLRSIRFRRVGVERVMERCYGFEVSIDGDDREPGRLWMIDARLSGLSLPSIETHLSAAATDSSASPDLPRISNVIPLRPRLPDDSTRH